MTGCAGLLPGRSSLRSRGLRRSGRFAKRRIFPSVVVHGPRVLSTKRNGMATCTWTVQKAVPRARRRRYVGTGRRWNPWRIKTSCWPPGLSSTCAGLGSPQCGPLRLCFRGPLPLAPYPQQSRLRMGRRCTEPTSVEGLSRGRQAHRHTTYIDGGQLSTGTSLTAGGAGRSMFDVDGTWSTRCYAVYN